MADSAVLVAPGGDEGLCIATGCRRQRKNGELFCAHHCKANAWKRGGWKSAYRRRKARQGAAV